MHDQLPALLQEEFRPARRLRLSRGHTEGKRKDFRFHPVNSFSSKERPLPQDPRGSASGFRMHVDERTRWGPKRSCLRRKRWPISWFQRNHLQTRSPFHRISLSEFVLVFKTKRFTIVWHVCFVTQSLSTIEFNLAPAAYTPFINSYFMATFGNDVATAQSPEPWALPLSSPSRITVGTSRGYSSYQQ